jgi:Fe(3+) dicitrate transport protein
MASGTQELSNQTYLGLTEFDAINNPRTMYTAAARDTMYVQRLMTRLSYTANLKKGWIRADVYRQFIDRNWHKLDKIDGGTGYQSIAAVLMDPTKFAREMAAMTGVDSGMAQIKSNKRIYVSRGVQIKGLWTQSMGALKVTHEGGARIHADYEDRFQQNDDYKIKNGEINPVKWGTPGTDANRIDYAQGLSGYYRMTASYQLWTIQAGVRGESVKAWREDFGKSNPNRENKDVKTRENAVDELMPGFSINRRMSKNWLAFGGVHRGFTPPGSTPGVLPEKSTNYELGVKHHTLPIQITYFRSEYDQLMGSDMAASGGTGSGDMFNGGRALVDGVEARYGLKYKGFMFEATATYTKARFTDSFKSTFEEWGNVQVDAPLPYMPTAQGTLMLGYTWKSVDFFWQSVYGSSRRSSSSLLTDDLPASWVHNLSVNYQATKRWSFRMSAQNLTNEQHIVAARPAGYRTYAPRMILGTVTFSIQ